MPQIYYGDDHKTIGDPEPSDIPEDICDKRIRLSSGCNFLVDGECHCDPDDCSEYCFMKKDCPEGRW